MPAQPKGPDFAYGPPQPGFSQMAPVGYQEQNHPGVPQVGGLSLRRPEPAPVQAYQPSGPRKTYITDVPPGLVPYHAGPAVPPKVRMVFITHTIYSIYCYNFFNVARKTNNIFVIIEKYYYNDG